MKTILSGILFLALTLSFIASASASLIYNDSTAYPPSSHSYSIPESQVDYATIDVKGTSGGESVCATFIYSEGSSYTAPCQKVPYLSWNTDTFSNPNSSLNVTNINVNGATHTYMKNLFVYTSEGSSSGDNTGNNQLNTLTNSFCGNGILEGNETCDSGENNGVLCTAAYDSSCNYCSDKCQVKTIRGEYCGDGILNTAFERCDDGNRIDNDGCSNECKKPFEVVVEGFVPLVWQCDHRVVYDDNTEPGRTSNGGQQLIERINDYAFEGEQVQWKVLVMDKNGIEKVKDIYSTVNGNIEANCKKLSDPSNNNFITDSVTNGIGIDPACNARIDEENITKFNPDTMAYYLCTLTVETPESMYGQSDVNVEVEDIDGQIGKMAETESWFLNPNVQLSVDGSISFDNMRPGTSSYSDRVLVGNNADEGSGVMLDMFISGTDFYDSASSGAKCPDTNQLSLSNFKYYATNGAYSTAQDLQVGRTCDSEGYCSINYGIGFNDPHPFYNANEILQAQKVGPYYTANVLAPGAEMSLIFKLNLPESCNGNFDAGSIYFWGEAV